MGTRLNFITCLKMYLRDCTIISQLYFLMWNAQSLCKPRTRIYSVAEKRKPSIPGSMYTGLKA